MEDIAPQLLEQLQKTFAGTVAANPKLRALEKLIREGRASYVDAEEYAYLVGQALSQTFGMHLSSAVLPDGRMYYNIAQRVLRPLMIEDHDIVAEAALQVQTVLNQKAGIGLKAQTVAVNEDRIDGIIDRVSSEENFDDIAWILDEPVINFSMNVVDEILKANVNFQGGTGLRPRIIRKAERKSCKWCANLVGEYDYPDLPHDVFRRHKYCRCTVEYDPGDGGKRQNVHTKRLTSPGERDIIEERKRFNLDNIDTFRPKDYASTISSYAKIDRASTVAAAEAGNRHGHAGVYMDAMEKSKKQLQKSIISRVSQVERHADKIAHPENYIADWSQKDPRYQQGLIKKWEKDMRRNAEQAEIELAVFEERF